MKLSLVKDNDPRTCVSETGTVLKPSGIREFFDIVSTMEDCISLGVGEPDFVTPWRIIDNAITAMKDGHTHYTSNRGLAELRDLIAEYLGTRYDLSYNPGTEILLTHGVSQGLDLALRSILNPGDEVIVFEPCYVSYSANVSMLYGKPVIIPTLMEDSFKIDIDRFKKAITPKTKAVLLNYPANPTGATLDRPTLEQIAQLAIEHNFIVLSDEIYSELTYDKEHFSIAGIPEMKNRTIYLSGFSKSHAMTGWRLGYVCGPEFIVDIMFKIHQYIALCASTIAQYAALEALKNGQKDVYKMKDEYEKRRNYIAGAFNDMGLPCVYPEGAFYVFPKITSTGLTSRDFALGLLKEEKVAVVPGSAFGDAGEGHIRCSYATSMGDLQESAKRIKHFISGRGK